MTDYISREEALQALCKAVHSDDGYVPCRNQLVSCRWTGTRTQAYAERILAIPAADVREVKRGKWVDDKGLYRCSACGHLWSELWWTANFPIERMLKTMPFCPNCGADMRKEEANGNV